MTRRAKFNLFFLILSLVLLVLNLIESYRENQISWMQILSNVLLILLFSMNIYNENKKQKQQQ
jgi:ABC-type nickel/cobalt efflux system permease component RcnA